MKRTMSVTAFTPEGDAILEDQENRSTVTVPRRWLPHGAKAGAELQALVVAVGDLSNLYLELAGDHEDGAHASTGVQTQLSFDKRLNGGYAVVVDAEGKAYTVPCTWLPRSAQPGQSFSVSRITHGGSSSLVLDMSEGGEEH